MKENTFVGFEFQGNYYEDIGNFMKEKYLEWGFIQGTKQEVDFLVELFELPKSASILDMGCVPGLHSRRAK